MCAGVPGSIPETMPRPKAVYMPALEERIVRLKDQYHNDTVTIEEYWNAISHAISYT